jgi:integrase
VAKVNTSEEIRNGSEPKKRVSTAQAKPLTHSFGKTDLRHWKERIFRPVYSRGGEEHESPNWAVEIQHRGRRHRWSLETPNRDAAAARAREIYLSVLSTGWEATLLKFRPEQAPREKQKNVTLGEFLQEVSAKSDGDPRTLAGYARVLRKIVADIFEIDGEGKHDYRKGGHAKWLEKVHSVKLADITPADVQAWKRAFLRKAGSDPLAQRTAKVSVNSIMRQSRSLFSPKITRHLDIVLPSPLPFDGVEFETRQSLKYHSGFNVLKLIDSAKEDLPDQEPESFKIFLLAVMIGLRRGEIDLLEWSAFRWDQSVIRIEPTKFFHPKSEDSIGDVQVDTELLKIFRGFRARSKGEFVIESSIAPKPGALYRHYRCEPHFQKLTQWLREHGVISNKPLHQLRKEFGSLINATYGIHAASRALRHADIGVTSSFYTDSRARVTAGLDHLLATEPKPAETLTEFPKTANQ